MIGLLSAVALLALTDAAILPQILQVEVDLSNSSHLIDPSLLIPLKRDFMVVINSSQSSVSQLLDPSLLTPAKRSLQARATTGQCGCGYSVTNPATGRIVNGQETVQHSKPYQVYLQSCSSQGCAMCGATLLNKRYAMTAMHCVEGATDLTLALGEHNIRQDIETHAAKSIRVERVIERADYTSADVNNDIALLRLAEDVVFTPNIVPACLPTDPAQTYSNWPAVVSGWGTTSEGGSTSDVLRETQQIILDQSAAECTQGANGAGSTASVPNSKLCGYKSGTDSCQGDSGGPLAVMEEGRWTVVGVVSYGFGCARPGYAGIYARVTNYLPWIQENIQDGWCSSTSSPLTAATTTAAPATSGQGPWCDFRCTNVRDLSAASVSLNGLPSTCSAGFCASTQGSSLCNTFNYPCGTAQPAAPTTTQPTTTPTTTQPTTTTKAPKVTGLGCARPCDLSLALAELKKSYPTGIFYITVGPSWNRIPAITDMSTGLTCPTDDPTSDLCQRLGLFGLFGK